MRNGLKKVGFKPVNSFQLLIYIGKPMIGILQFGSSDLQLSIGVLEFLVANFQLFISDLQLLSPLFHLSLQS